MNYYCVFKFTEDVHVYFWERGTKQIPNIEPPEFLMWFPIGCKLSILEFLDRPWHSSWGWPRCRRSWPSSPPPGCPAAWCVCPSVPPALIYQTQYEMYNVHPVIHRITIILMSPALIYQNTNWMWHLSPISNSQA